MESLSYKILIVERKIAATEADGHKLRNKYYRRKYKKLMKKLAKVLRKKAGIKEPKKKKHYYRRKK